MKKKAGSFSKVKSGQSRKKIYSPPQLTKYGPLKKLTTGASGEILDSGLQKLKAVDLDG